MESLSHIHTHLHAFTEYADLTALRHALNLLRQSHRSTARTELLAKVKDVNVARARSCVESSLHRSSEELVQCYEGLSMLAEDVWERSVPERDAFICAESLSVDEREAVLEKYGMRELYDIGRSRN